MNGSGTLAPAEEAGLFRIAQEALNNVVKHAGIRQAVIRLQLDETPWMEIVDEGTGFDRRQVEGGDRMGLAGMSERAAEIGWQIGVESAPGAGTRIRVEKKQAGEA